MKDSLFPRLHGAFDRRSLDVVVEVAGQQVGHYHGGQQVDGVARLSIDLLRTASNPLGRLLVRVVLLFDHHTKPEMQRTGGGVKRKEVVNKIQLTTGLIH